MSRLFATRLSLGLALLMLSTACVTGAKLREDAKLIEKKIASARQRGSYRCAPAYLARAEANLEFLKYELGEGDFRRAGWHHRKALENINRALDITDPNECAEKRVLIQDAPKQIIIQNIDLDGDGIHNDKDACPDIPEDFDGYEDVDGCPDPDNDGDGILDVDDKCPLDPEDKDNFEDEDGCPDLDNDKDTILDVDDKCPLEPEDKDGFEDEDGCPDPDNDGDGVLDPVDQCPDELEDKDGFADEDGCPDPDNDSDKVLDVDDACPNTPGDPANKGCPVDDRDGDGIADDVDQCPDIPEDLDGNEDEDGCPEEENLDSDGDGILDNDDKCPQEPEDLDQFEDEDGCPDPDNDQDTVLDMVDACPLQAGSPANSGCPVMDRDGDGVNDDVDVCPDVPGVAPKGCPKRVLVVVTKDKIEIKQQIKFQTGKAVIKRGISYEILDQVGAVLKSNPNLKLVIEGHTDSKGKASYNLRLSDDRAHSVLAALLERGVSPKRLEAIGYGESRPISSNKSRKGRAANRRVEFNIVQED